MTNQNLQRLCALSRVRDRPTGLSNRNARRCPQELLLVLSGQSAHAKWDYRAVSGEANTQLALVVVKHAVTLRSAV